MAGWDNRDFDILFGDHPPTESKAPTAEECYALGMRLGRTHGSVKAQWGDARSLVLGQQSAASEQLRDYLRSHGWLDRSGGRA